jgi:dihydropteroate synthase
MMPFSFISRETDDQRVSIVGILNLTPDSFSDGGSYASLERAEHRAYELISEGADVVEVGGDSTRPGSSCVGPDLEWQRIEALLDRLKGRVPVAVDTHHAQVARRAIEYGAILVNDVSSGADAEMLPLIAASGVGYIGMFNPNPPHEFDRMLQKEGARSAIEGGFQALLERATQTGISKAQLVLDTGMGAFLSRDPAVSWEVLRHYQDFGRFGCSLMLGCSRKGFLRQDNEQSVVERDAASALCVAYVVRRVDGVVPLLLRVHNVKMHRAILAAADKMEAA